MLICSDVPKKAITEHSSIHTAFQHKSILHDACILYKDGNDNIADFNF